MSKFLLTLVLFLSLVLPVAAQRISIWDSDGNHTSGRIRPRGDGSERITLYHPDGSMTTGRIDAGGNVYLRQSDSIPTSNFDAARELQKIFPKSENQVQNVPVMEPGVIYNLK